MGAAAEIRRKPLKRYVRCTVMRRPSACHLPRRPRSLRVTFTSVVGVWSAARHRRLILATPIGSDRASERLRSTDQHLDKARRFGAKLDVSSMVSVDDVLAFAPEVDWRATWVAAVSRLSSPRSSSASARQNRNRTWSSIRQTVAPVILNSGASTLAIILRPSDFRGSTSAMVRAARLHVSTPPLGAKLPMNAKLASLWPLTIPLKRLAGPCDLSSSSLGIIWKFLLSTTRARIQRGRRSVRSRSRIRGSPLSAIRSTLDPLSRATECSRSRPETSLPGTMRMIGLTHKE